MAFPTLSSRQFNRLATEFHRLWISFIRLLYPAYCIFCRQNLALFEQTYACRHCINQMPPIKKPFCAKCASEIAPYGPPRTLCNRCLKQKTYYKQAVSIFRYESGVRHLIQRVKFAKKSWYLNTVSRYLGRAETPLPFSNYDLIVPVPMDSRRKREREFNQSLLIAKLLKKQKKALVPISNVIRKIKKTKPQSALSREERMQNLNGAFRLKQAARIHMKKILLVDDVITTGSTVNECAKCLVEGGAGRVDVLSLSRTAYR